MVHVTSAMQSLPLTFSIKFKAGVSSSYHTCATAIQSMSYKNRQSTAGCLQASKPTAAAVTTMLYDPETFYSLDTGSTFLI